MAKLPGEVSTGASTPPGQYEARLGHGAACARCAPAGQKKPGGHGTQSSDADGRREAVPRAQAAHAAAPAAAYAPAGHGAHAAEAFGAERPGVHGVGAVAASGHAAPAGQGTGAAAAAGQKNPGGHG